MTESRKELVRWACVERHQNIDHFTQAMGAHPVLSAEQFYTDADIR